MIYLYTLLYLCSAVAANLSIFYFGPAALFINAFVFIGFDITCRDKLHDAWHGKGLTAKMGLLIATASGITYLINSASKQIAIASTAAFFTQALVDALVYQLLFKQNYLVRVNSSNICSSLADSFVFPTLAFGSFSWPITLGQAACKIFGGWIWSLVLYGRPITFKDSRTKKRT